MAKNTVVWVIVLGLLVFAGTNGLTKNPFTGQPFSAAGVPGAVTSTSGVTCPSGLQNLQVLTATTIPASYGQAVYLNAPVAIVRASNGALLATATDATGTTLSYTTTTLGCDNDIINNGVTVYGTPGPTTGNFFTSSPGSAVTFAGGSTTGRVVVIASNSSMPLARWLTSTLSNDTTTGDTVTPISNTNALTQSQAFTEILQLNGFAGTNQTGQGTIVGVYFNTSTTWRPNDVSLSIQSGGASLTQAQCTAYPGFLNNRKPSRCYLITPLTSQTGVVQISVTGSASAGNPGGSGSDNPVIYIDPLNNFVDPVTQKIAYDAYDSTNVKQGPAGIVATYSTS